MSDAPKFRNKYRIPSARADWWNYSNAGSYFVTICIASKEHAFGEVRNRKMELSALGKYVEEQWLFAVEARPDMNIHLDAFVVMPNHFHGIIYFDNKVSMDDATEPTLDEQDLSVGNSFMPQSKNLASIMRGFKSSVTSYAIKQGIGFNWQPRYHDRIIRNAAEHEKIRNYILSNPWNWDKDRYNEP